MSDCPGEITTFSNVLLTQGQSTPLPICLGLLHLCGWIDLILLPPFQWTFCSWFLNTLYILHIKVVILSFMLHSLSQFPWCILSVFYRWPYISLTFYLVKSIILFLYRFCLRALLKRAFPNPSLYNYSPVVSPRTLKLSFRNLHVEFILGWVVKWRATG